MSRIRWGLACALGLVALIAALGSVRSYAAHGLTLGVLAVLALVAILVAGTASLAAARLRIGRELRGLAGTPRSGELITARRLRLEQVRAADVTPDLDVLAQATAAAEAGRAYLGRYVVASAVMVGLVGTFAGLIETLGKLAPLLREGDAGGGSLALLAAPLGGLHVTFGASLVAILVTLALALAQGDLTLHEDQALATLEDVTRHELVPASWPATTGPAERTIHELAELRRELRTQVADGITAAVERASERFAAGVTDQVGRAGGLLEAAVARVEERLGRHGTTVATELTTHAERQASALVAHSERLSGELATHSDRQSNAMSGQSERLAALLSAQSERLTGELTAQSERLMGELVGHSQRLTGELSGHSGRLAAELASHSQGFTAELSAATQSTLAATSADLRATTAAAMTEARAGVIGVTEGLRDGLHPLFTEQSEKLAGAAQALDRSAEAVQTASGQIEAIAPALEALAARHAAALDAASSAVMGALDRAVTGGGTAVERAGADLARAANELRTGTERLSPQLGTLAAELASLSREVALLAADRDDGEADRVVLSEIERVGEGLERLSELVRRARGAQPQDERRRADDDEEPLPPVGATSSALPDDPEGEALD